MEGVPARKLRGFTGISLQCVTGFVVVGFRIIQCCQLIWNATSPSVCRETLPDLMCNLYILISSDSMTQKPSGYPEMRDAAKKIELWPKFLRNLDIFNCPKQWFASLQNFKCFADLCLHFSHYLISWSSFEKILFYSPLFFWWVIVTQWPSASHTFIFFLWCERNGHQYDLSLSNNLEH